MAMALSKKIHVLLDMQCYQSGLLTQEKSVKYGQKILK
jgi:hypothetical protein